MSNRFHLPLRTQRARPQVDIERMARRNKVKFFLLDLCLIIMMIASIVLVALAMYAGVHFIVKYFMQYW